jgi:hypothetical protein
MGGIEGTAEEPDPPLRRETQGPGGDRRQSD